MIVQEVLHVNNVLQYNYIISYYIKCSFIPVIKKLSPLSLSSIKFYLNTTKSFTLVKLIQEFYSIYIMYVMILNAKNVCINPCCLNRCEIFESVKN